MEGILIESSCNRLLNLVGFVFAIEVPDKFIFSKIMTTFAYEPDEILKESSIKHYFMTLIGKTKQTSKRQLLESLH